MHPNLICVPYWWQGVEQTRKNKKKATNNQVRSQVKTEGNQKTLELALLYSARIGGDGGGSGGNAQRKQQIYVALPTGFLLTYLMTLTNNACVMFT